MPGLVLGFHGEAVEDVLGNVVILSPLVGETNSEVKIPKAEACFFFVHDLFACAGA